MPATFPVRVGARAIVREDDAVLAVAYDDASGPHYNLPGGGLEAGESVREALVREVREETTADIAVGDLRFVFEYDPAANDGAYGETHKLTLYFARSLVEGDEPALPADPDPDQVGVEWLPIGELGVGDAPLLPDLGREWRGIVRGDAGVRFVDGG